MQRQATDKKWRYEKYDWKLSTDSAVASHRRPLGPETDRKPGTATVTILRLLIADSKEEECRKSAWGWIYQQRHDDEIEEGRKQRHVRVLRADREYPHLDDEMRRLCLWVW